MNPFCLMVMTGITLHGVLNGESTGSHGVPEDEMLAVETTNHIATLPDTTVVDSAIIAEIERDMILLKDLDLLSDLELFTHYDLLNDEDFDVSVSSEEKNEHVPTD